MASTGVRITGLTETQAALAGLGRSMADLDAVRTLGDDAADEASETAPVGPTGRLSRSIRATHGPNRTTITAGGGSVVYAGYINDGLPSRNIEPQPFMPEPPRLTLEAIVQVELNLRRLIARYNLT